MCGYLNIFRRHGDRGGCLICIGKGDSDVRIPIIKDLSGRDGCNDGDNGRFRIPAAAVTVDDTEVIGRGNGEVPARSIGNKSVVRVPEDKAGPVIMCIEALRHPDQRVADFDDISGISGDVFGTAGECGVGEGDIHTGLEVEFIVPGNLCVTRHRERATIHKHATAVFRDGVAGDDTLLHRECSSTTPHTHAAASARGVVGDFSVLHREHATIHKHTTTEIRGVAGDDAVLHRERAGTSTTYTHAATICRGVAGDFAARHRERAIIHKHAATVSCDGVVGDCAAGHRERATHIHTAAVCCAVAGDFAARHRERATITHKHAAAVVGHGVIGECSSLQSEVPA